MIPMIAHTSAKISAEDMIPPLSVQGRMTGRPLDPGMDERRIAFRR